jgi:DNA invertase Pin-like site-specific DNA recombinase
MEPAPVAVGYTRVSSRQQAENGTGLETQADAIEAWCAENGYQLAGIWSDPGVTGTLAPEDRDGWQEMLAAAPEGATIVVHNLNRLSRNLIGQETTLMKLDAAGFRLHSIAEPDHGTDANDDPTRVLIRQVLGAIAQYDRATLTARMKHGKAKKRAAGGYVGGRVPYGWVRHPDTDLLVEDPGEQRIIGELRRLHGVGWSANRIARHLNDLGIPTKLGRKWAARTVIETLRYCDKHNASGGKDRMLKVDQRMRVR